MAVKVWEELIVTLRKQLQSNGYTGYLLPFFHSKAQHLEDMIKRTVLMSESNSVLIIGPPGSGKSALLEYVLKTLFKNKAVKNNMLLVNLNGLIHTNDNLALADITKQLEMHSTENRSCGSFSEKLRQVLHALKSGTKESKSVLFVLDNFDLFSTHKNQTLLYNLFDVAQSQQSPICVVGMSCRPDVLQVLENRVNSRFSHQKILLFDEITFDEYLESAREFLSLSEFSDSKFLKKWNSDAKVFLKNEAVKIILERRYNMSNSLRDLKQLLYIATHQIKDSYPKLTVESFEAAYNYCTQDCKSSVITDLSVLELGIVIAMMHLTEIYDGEPFNFEIVHNELSKFFRRKMGWNIEKSVVMKAFEHLIDLELVKSCSESTAHFLKRYMLVRLLVTSGEIKNAIGIYQNLPSQLQHWAESNIDSY